MMRRMMLRRVGGVDNILKDSFLVFSLQNEGFGFTPVVRVMRDSDNSEQDFTSTEIINGALTSFCGSANGLVKIWYEQKSGFHATNANNTQLPKIVSNGSLILENGEPTIYFGDGTVIKRLLTPPLIINKGVSNFVLCKPENNQTSYILGQENGAALLNRYCLGLVNNTTIRHWLSVDDIKGSTGFIAGNQTLITSILDDVDSTLEQNNTVINSQNTNKGNTESGRLSIGNIINNAGVQFSGNIQGIYLFNANKFVEKEVIKNYLTNKYQI